MGRDWRRALPSLLLQSYVVFLPFLRLEIRIFLYGVSISDLLAGMAFAALFLAEGWGAFSGIAAEFRRWLGAFCLFALVLIPSLWHAKYPSCMAVELLPFIHAGLLTIILSRMVTDQGREGLLRLRAAYRFSLAVAMLPILVSTVLHPSPFLTEAFSDTSGKYRFLLRSTNQLAIFAATGLVLTISCGRIEVPKDLLLFIVSGIGILQSGSRTGALVYFFLAASFLLLLVWRFGTGELSARRCFLSVVALMAFCAMMVFRPEGYAVRSTSVIQTVASGQIGDPFRVVQFKTASGLFWANPILGIGLGNYRPLSADGHEIHNSFISLLVETGCLGFAGLIVLQAFLVFSVLRSPRSWGSKAGALAGLGAFLICMNAHQILRERWLWLAYFMIVGSSARSLIPGARHGEASAGDA